MWSPGGGLARWQVLQALESEPGEDAAAVCRSLHHSFPAGQLEIDPELLDFASYVEARPPLSGWPVDELTRAHRSGD